MLGETPHRPETEGEAVSSRAADEGVGILAVAALSNQHLLRVLSQLMNYVQALWGNPPATGARIITSILCNPALLGEW